MKTHYSFIRTLSLTIILVFAIVAIASAGAVLRRDRGDRGQDKGKSAVSEKSEQPRQSEKVNRSDPRDNGRSNSYQPGERSNNTSGTIRYRKPDRQEPDRARDFNRPTYRPTTKPDRPDYRPDNTSTYRPSVPDSGKYQPDRTMRDRKIDSSPSYRPSELVRRSGDDHRSSYYRLRRRYEQEGKYDRVRERQTFRQNDRVVYRPPVYRGGYYYYNYGWPHYYNYPLRYAHWYFDYEPNRCYRSAYYYYGYFPYLPVARVVIVKRPVVTYIEIPIVIKEKSYYDGYYLEDRYASSIDKALGDIRRAWVFNDPDYLLDHVRDYGRIDVLLDYNYAYSVDTDDYKDMTSDAIKSTETVDFEFITVRKRGDDKIIAYARHTFYNLDNERRIVYVSYELERRSGEWYITEVGSSLRSPDY